MNLPNGQKKAEPWNLTGKSDKKRLPSLSTSQIVATSFMGVCLILLLLLFLLIVPDLWVIYLPLFCHGAFYGIMYWKFPDKLEEWELWDLEHGRSSYWKRAYMKHKESRLESLRQLYEKRLITAQEYEQKKEEILKDI